MSKKVIAIILALTLSFSMLAVPASAASIEIPENIENIFYTALEKIMDVVLSYLNKYWPGSDGKWDNVDDYVADYFYAGKDSFDTTVKDGAKWSLGYSGASLIDGIDVMNGDYFLAGSLEATKGRVPTEIVDDQRVRVFALSDGVSGTVLYAVLDAFGISRGDVEEIRSRIDEFAKANNIVSVNVSVLHQHSCIDTLGLNVPLVQALIVNTGNNCTDGALNGIKITKNQSFMNELFDRTVKCMKEAVNNMKEGTLSSGKTDISQYIRDKRDPQTFDGNIHRLRFVPNDGSAETWILEAGIHAVNFGASTDKLTADFPYYVEKSINEKDGANVVYVQGAELAITTDRTLTSPGESATSLEEVVAYANTIADKVRAIKDDYQIDPILNIAFKEVAIDVTNDILKLATKEDLLNAVIVKDGNNVKMITEIGYMELGNKVAVFVCPGEFEPAIIYGGAATPEESWNGTSWDYAPLKDYTNCEDVLVFGLCNDQVGYVITDNEYHSLFTENEEAMIVSKTAGSTFAENFIELITGVKTVTV